MLPRHATSDRYRPPPRLYSLLAEHNGERYLVALAGESEWVRNARAAGGRVVLGRRRRRPATLVEVPAKDRAPVIRAYMLRGGRRPGSTAVTREARDYFGLDAALTLAEIGSVADRYPVFRVIPRGHGEEGRTCGPCRTASRP